MNKPALQNARQQRLAAKLKENLRRRKRQARARGAATMNEPAETEISPARKDRHHD